jgi:hypothetical protein
MNRLYFLGGKGMRIAWNDEEAALGRLFWLGMPLKYGLQMMLQLFRQLICCYLYCMYCTLWKCQTWPVTTIEECIFSRVVDPDWFNTDPDQAFLLNPDPDPS